MHHYTMYCNGKLCCFHSLIGNHKTFPGKHFHSYDKLIQQHLISGGCTAEIYLGTWPTILYLLVCKWLSYKYTCLLSISSSRCFSRYVLADYKEKRHEFDKRTHLNQGMNVNKCLSQIVILTVL